ncbi:MAG: di-trans,poly-cis-decaprenylcistransferase [Nanoarchaeota archaeon]|jgi:tritrans,polycis-undecaprenyl-diphosphate synthase [geranylgeranyl-diphosphate specific]|nr:di-trans,poly-cis-decaprenylcistransferase [Nanoarchaeota archaeon]|tara:strand:- start:20897 stop:21601 length:705 start_codon:yes stop_codon:yes gene_type:complete
MEISNVPKHVGIILDGNRRFAKRLMLKPWKGHEWGYNKIKELFDWCKEYQVKELTLYAFSIENFNRPKDEFNFLMKLFETAFKETKKNKKIHEDKIRINFIGRINMFPKNVQDSMQDLMDSTKDYSNFTVNFAMAYGGRAEIIDATKKIASQIKEGKLNIDDINDEVFKKNIYLESEPDLIIRTSEQRLSGFLLWQSSYAEIQFLPDVLWPEFSKEIFLQCLKNYSKRSRRFGK